VTLYRTPNLCHTDDFNVLCSRVEAALADTIDEELNLHGASPTELLGALVEIITLTLSSRVINTQLTNHRARRANRSTWAEVSNDRDQ